MIVIGGRARHNQQQQVFVKTHPRPLEPVTMYAGNHNLQGAWYGTVTMGEMLMPSSDNRCMHARCRLICRQTWYCFDGCRFCLFIDDMPPEKERYPIKSSEYFGEGLLAIPYFCFLALYLTSQI